MDSYLEYKKCNRHRKPKTSFQTASFAHTSFFTGQGTYDMKKQFLKIKSGFHTLFLLIISILLFITILQIL